MFEEIENRGLSIAKFSKESGIPSDRVYQWERGRGNPKAEDTEKIQKWLDKIPSHSKDIENLNELQIQIKALNAVVETLMMEIASLRAEKNGEPVMTVLKRLQKAAELPF